MKKKGDNDMNYEAKKMGKIRTDVRVLAISALFAALSYISFQVFRIDIPLGTEKTAFHLGNTFVALGAMLIGGPLGGAAGAVGMTIADLTSGYATSTPKTFVLKLLIGLIVGLVAHKGFKLSKVTDKRILTLYTGISAAAGLGFNVVADPLLGYFYKQYVLGLPQDISIALSKISAATTFVNAVASVICATGLYLIVRPILKKSGFYREIE